jgi:hypothetical protein
MLVSSTFAIALGLPVIVFTAYTFTKGMVLGCITSNEHAQTLLNNNNDIFELGVSAGNMIVWGPRSFQFIQ